MNLPRSTHPYYPGIDGLRAIAVMAVVLYHLDGAWLPGGFSGVDVFFVISGFVVSGSVGSRAPEGLLTFTTRFLARRLRRIAPALIACLVVTALVVAVLVPDAWLSRRNQVTGRFAFFGFSNVAMVRFSNDYFSPVAEFNPYTHTWSLGVEEQFYLLFPLIFCLWAWGGRRRTVSVAATALLTLLSFGFACWSGEHDPTRAFYLLPTRFWEIGAGVSLYQVTQLLDQRGRGTTRMPEHWSSRWAFASAGLVAFGMLASTPQSFPAPGALPSVLGTCGLLAFMRREPHQDGLMAALSSRPLVAIGRLSYSLYLWHWPVFVVFRWTVGLEALPLQLLALAMAIVLAVISYRCIETPIRKSAMLGTLRSGVTMVLGAAALAAGLWTMKGITHSQAELSVSTVTREARDWYPDDGRVTRETTRCAVMVDEERLARGLVRTFSSRGCVPRRDSPDVYVVGDSHAVALGETFAAYARDTGATVRLYDNDGCPFLSLDPRRDDTPNCARSSALVIERLTARLREGDVVFLPSLRMPRYLDQWATVPGKPIDDAIFSDEATRRLAVSAARAGPVLDRIAATGARVVIMAPNLLLKLPLFRCADPYDAVNPVCAAGPDVDRAHFEMLRRPMFDALERLADTRPGLTIWDAFPVLCPPSATCHAYRDGHPLFFDGDHLSGYANRLLLPSFKAAMRRAVPGH